VKRYHSTMAWAPASLQPKGQLLRLKGQKKATATRFKEMVEEEEL